MGQEVKTLVLGLMSNMQKVSKIWGFKKKAKKENEYLKSGVYYPLKVVEDDCK